MTICIGRPIIETLAREGAWTSGSGESVVAASELFGANPYDKIERLRAALNEAAYALFQIKRMQPDAVREFASDAHTKACAVLDGDHEQSVNKET